MRKLFKNEIGITLISLVVTIIILLLLAGVSIASLSGSGLFEKAKLAKEEYSNSQTKEETEIAKYTNEIDYNISTSTREITYLIPGIDVSNVLQTIADDSNTTWDGHGSCSYIATQDCYVMGYIRCYKTGSTDILINNVCIGMVNNTDSTSDIYVPINYLLKSGDKIEFNANGSNIKCLKAYGLRYE